MPFFLPAKPAKSGASSATRPTKLVVKDKTKPQPAAGPSPYTPALLWLLLGLGVGACLGTGWYFARRALLQQTAIRARVPAGQGAVVVAVPPWISGAEKQAILEGLGSCISADPLDGDSLAEAVKSLSHHPAVGQVVRAWRDTDGLVKFNVKWYVPAGIVVGRAGATLSVVDVQGHLLAEHLPAETADRIRVPRIEGVDTPAPYNGGIWDSQRLQAGLRMLALLSPLEQSRIRTLRVGELDAQHRLNLSFVLKTPQGPMDILWGLPVGQEAGVDAPAADKLKALSALYADPDVRSGRAGSRFSIRHGRVMVTSDPPLPTQADQGRAP